MSLRATTGLSCLSRAERFLLAAPRSRHVCAYRTDRRDTQSQLDQRDTQAEQRLPASGPWKSRKQMRAAEPIINSTEDTIDAQERLRRAVDRLQARWEVLENKKTLIVLALGSFAGTWLAGRVLDTVDHVPLLPSLLTFLGLVYSGSFFWKYVLFYEGRQELRATLAEAYQSVRDTLKGQEYAFTAGQLSSPSPSVSSDDHELEHALDSPTTQPLSNVSPIGSKVATPLGQQMRPGSNLSAAPRADTGNGVGRGGPIPAIYGRASMRRVITAATGADASFSDIPAHNTSTNPEPAAAPHQTGPGTVTDDATWMAMAKSEPEPEPQPDVTSSMEQLEALPVNCNEQPANTTPCPTPGSAPHKDDLVYNDDIWYKDVPPSGDQRQEPGAEKGGSSDTRRH